MKKIMKVLSLLLTFVFAMSVFTGCLPTEQIVETVVEGGQDLVTVQWVWGQKVLREDHVERGSKLTEWIPEIAGREFQGWYERPYIKKFDFGKTTVKASMRIYASFKGGDDPVDIEQEMPDWYLIGAGKGDLSKCNNWQHEAAASKLGLYAGEDGIYKITLNLYAGDQFKMTSNLGWDNEKAIDKMAGFANGSVKDAEGNVIFTAGENNNFVVADGQDGKYEITYDATNDVMGFKKLEALETMPDDIRLIGDVNGWSTNYGEDDYKFTSADGVNWTYVWEVTDVTTFKVYNHSSGVYYPGGVDNDLHIDAAGTYTVHFNSKTREIVVKDADGNNVDVGFSNTSGGGNEGGGSTVTPNANPVDKVYMVLNSDWNDGSIVGAWVWANGADGQMVVATPTSDANVYEVAIPAGTNLIVFFDLNAGATELGDQWANKRVQSEDMAIPDKSDDKVYYHVSNGTWSNSSENAGSGSGTPGQLPEGQGILVFFQNNWKWTEVSAYYWGTASDPTWPGNAMTLVGEVDGYEVYAIRIPEGVSGLVFNGKKDDGSGQLDQTPDITEGLVDGAGWKMDWIQNANAAVEFIYNPDGCSHSSEGEGTVVTPATCTTGGQTSYVCSKCSETYTLNTPALGHNYGADGTCATCGIGSVYTAVGMAGLCGSDWNTNDTANDMTYDEATGVYTKVFTGIAAGTYEYKVVLNHKWGAGEYPTNAVNASVTVSADNSTVTITWNPTTQVLEATIS